jgi:CBS domain-containing protein
MRDNIAALPADVTAADAVGALRTDHPNRRQALYPVVDAENKLTGVITRGTLEGLGADPRPVRELARRNPVVAYSGESLRAVVYRMAETGVTRMPVVRSEEDRHLAGMVSLQDLLTARTRNLEEERRRERVLRIHFPFRSKVR